MSSIFYPHMNSFRFRNDVLCNIISGLLFYLRNRTIFYEKAAPTTVRSTVGVLVSYQFVGKNTVLTFYFFLCTFVGMAMVVQHKHCCQKIKINSKNNSKAAGKKSFCRRKLLVRRFFPRLTNKGFTILKKIILPT